jgi:hypothetical protein
MKFNVLPSQGGKYFVNITSMLNADLTTIFLALQWDQDQTQNVDRTQRFNPLQFIEMRNVALLLNGQRLHNYDEANYKNYYLSSVMDGAHPILLSSAPIRNTGVNPNTYARDFVKKLQSPIYELNISRLRACANEAEMMNTPRYTNQTMQIEFTIDKGLPNFIPAQTDDPKLVLTTLYSYNAVFMTGQDGGQSKLVTA